MTQKGWKVPVKWNCKKKKDPPRSTPAEAAALSKSRTVHPEQTHKHKCSVASVQAANTVNREIREGDFGPS